MDLTHICHRTLSRISKDISTDTLCSTAHAYCRFISLPLKCLVVKANRRHLKSEMYSSKLGLGCLELWWLHTHTYTHTHTHTKDTHQTHTLHVKHTPYTQNYVESRVSAVLHIITWLPFSGLVGQLTSSILVFTHILTCIHERAYSHSLEAGMICFVNLTDAL